MKEITFEADAAIVRRFFARGLKAVKIHCIMCLHFPRASWSLMETFRMFSASSICSLNCESWNSSILLPNLDKWRLRHRSPPRVSIASWRNLMAPLYRFLVLCVSAVSAVCGDAKVTWFDIGGTELSCETFLRLKEGKWKPFFGFWFPSMDPSV